MIETLECAACRRRVAPDRLWNLCPHCSSPLLARYDLEALARTWRPSQLAGRERGVWRWREVLPVETGEEPLTLGEGGTPLLRSRAIGLALGMPRLAFKDESCNPTLSARSAMRADREDEQRVSRDLGRDLLRPGGAVPLPLEKTISS